MKKIILFTFALLLMSCGVKKELKKANQNNNELKQELQDLKVKSHSQEKKLTKCEAQNSNLKRKNIGLVSKTKALQKKINLLAPENSEKLVAEDAIFTTEIQPEFIGGQREMMMFIVKNIKYPEIAIENNVQGKVYIEFFINTDGSVSDAKVIRGIGYGCDKEALRVVELMPNWKPGQQRGKAVRAKYRLPVSFRLQ